MGKRGQMKLSFGMIFSIFLIIIFIAFAFFAINKFISTQRTVQYHQFIQDLQGDIDKMWKEQQSSQAVSYSIPSSIKQVCLTRSCGDLGMEFNCYSNSDNIVFNSTRKVFDSAFISHLDIDRTVGGNRRMKCFEVVDGKVDFMLIKTYGVTNVVIASPN